MQPVSDNSNDVSDILDSRSLAERRSRRENRQLPLRYRTDNPEPLASLPPVAHLPSPDSNIPLPGAAAEVPARRILKSPSNKFGLFRQYFATSFPDHDPESNMQAVDLSDAAVDHDEVDIIPPSLFQPYPNQSAFLLGEWYWNGGSQKSQDSFEKLVNIVSAGDFNPADIRGIPWTSIHKCIGKSSNLEDIWLDEPDAGW